MEKKLESIARRTTTGECHNPIPGFDKTKGADSIRALRASLQLAI